MTEQTIKRIANMAADSAQHVCRHFLPNGKRSGNEWECADRTGAEGKSLKVHLSGEKCGIWSDFATGDKGGDLVSLVAYLQGLTQSAAARVLAQHLGLPLDEGNDVKPERDNTRPESWRAIMPIPDNAPPRPQSHYKHGKPDCWHTYNNENGKPLGFVARFDANTKRGRKEFAWLIFAELRGRREWRWQGFTPPRPLYGLEFLRTKPGAPVLLVEGEKTAEAARRLFPQWLCITWPGGSQATSKADFKPLAGRDVYLWPDNDEPGHLAMQTAGKLAIRAGAAKVIAVNTGEIGNMAPGKDSAGAPNLTEQPRDLPKGWDAADAEAEGWTPEHFHLLLHRAEFFRETSAPTADNTKAAIPTNGGDPRFHSNPRGLFFLDVNPDSDEPRKIRICDPLTVSALARDTEGGSWSAVIEFKNLDGQTRQVNLPCKLFLGDGMDGPKHLADLGLFIEPGRQNLERLKTYIAGSRPNKRARLLEQLGWFEGAYLLPGEILGQSKEMLIYNGSRRAHGAFAENGSIDAWREHVGTLARGNPRLLLSLSVGLVGPLLNPCGGPSFAIHWTGDSSEGKSGCLHAAGSIWGNPATVCHSWRQTDNALEYTAAQHNDGLLILDELKEVDPKSAGAIAYMLSNAKGKGRAHHAGGLRESNTWRIAMLSSGELGLVDHLASAGQKIHAGQSVRFIELPSNGGANLGMWNELHRHPDGRAFTDHLKAAAGKYYGTAGRAFVKGLIQLGGESRERVKLVEQAFFNKFSPPDASGQVKRVASCFALIAAAGELGRLLDVMPWDEWAAFEAAGALFGEWLENRPTAGNLEEAQILTHVRGLIDKSWQSQFIDWDRTTNSDTDKAPDLSRMAAVHNTLGYRKPDPAWTHSNPQWLFYIPRTRFQEEFANKAGFKPKRVAAILKAAGILKCDSGSTTYKETLPSGDPRSYCIIGRNLWRDGGRD